MKYNYCIVLLLLFVSIDIVQNSTLSPYTISTITIQLCKSSMCNGNGECKDKDGKTECVCDPMYTGLSCETNLGDCSIKGGDCEPKCPLSMSEKDCACHSLGCVNGMCVESENITDEFVICKCDGGFEGDLCDQTAPTTGYRYIYVTVSTISTQFLMSAVVGASASIAVLVLFAIVGLVVFGVIWTIRKYLAKRRGMSLTEDQCQYPENKDDSMELEVDQRLEPETIELETVQAHSCILDLPLISLNDPDIQKDSICHEDPPPVSYPVISKPAEATKLQTTFVEYGSREFNHKGGKYTSDLFCLSIPSGSIPEDTVITVAIGITFCTELMSLLPPKFKAVSPIVELCIKEQPKFKFLKPVTIKIQHYLDIKSEVAVESMSLHFFKSGHNLCCFHLTDGLEEYDIGSHYGVLTIDHFCSFCIAADKAKIDLGNVYCYIMRILPRHISSPKWDAVYCVCLFTCSIIVEKQYKTTEYEVKKIKLFKFHTFCLEPPYLELNFDRQPVGGWNLSLQYSGKITAAELDYTLIEPVILECMERDQLYPPRYTINVSGRTACCSSLLELQFTGSMDCFKTELLLESPDMADQLSSLFGPEGTSKLDITPSHIDLMNRVAAKIPTKWRNLGIQLGLPPNDLDVFEARHGGDYLRIYSCIFAAWENQVTKPFTWDVIILSLKTPLMAEHKLAEEIQTAVYPITTREIQARGSRTSSFSSVLGPLSQLSVGSTYSVNV